MMTTKDKPLRNVPIGAFSNDSETLAKQPRTIQSLERALNLVEILAASKHELPLNELASRAVLNVSTCHHLLATLAKRGFVSQNPRTRAYLLGNRIMELSKERLKQFNLTETAMPELQKLNDTTRETVLLSALQGHMLVILATLNSQMPIGVGTYDHEYAKAVHATANGKAILAWLPETEIERTVSVTGLSRFTDRTIISLAELLEEFRHVRRNGYAIDDEEFQQGVVSFGDAIRDVSGAVIGAVSCLMPKMRDDAEHRKRVIEDLKRCASAISEQLGGVDRSLGAPTV